MSDRVDVPVVQLPHMSHAWLLVALVKLIGSTKKLWRPISMGAHPTICIHLSMIGLIGLLLVVTSSSLNIPQALSE